MPGKQERSGFTMSKVDPQGQTSYKSGGSEWPAMFFRFGYIQVFLSCIEGRLSSLSSQGFLGMKWNKRMVFYRKIQTEGKC